VIGPLPLPVVRLQSKTELVALAALAYVPFLASSPGRVSADSKQDLYLDPGRFLSRAVDLWDPHVGAGSVPHQNLGYLFPTGPWFWLSDHLGVPDWVAQRLWLGTISLLAVLGARWLFQQLGTGRVGALAGAVVYLLTPYQLAFTARMSVLLLPWAALPWLVGLTMRATRTRDWRAPALLALVLLAAGGINASSLLLVALGPLLWVALELCRGRESARRALAGAGRVGLLAAGVSLWWLVGVRVQGAHGLPVLQLTENVRTVAEASTPSDVLRGLGNWFFYGHDRTGYSVDQAAAYAGASDVVVVLSYAVPMAAVAAAFLLRWAHRAFFGLLVVTGTIIGVGSWPYDDPSPYGSLWKTFTSDTSVGLAFRNSPRVVPLVVLGVAGLLAGAVGAIPALPWRRLGGAAVAVVAGAALLPVWQHGYLTAGMQRPEHLPGYWLDATRAMDAGDHGTRVLEVPGTSFAAYRWGTTVDPITPGLIDRPYLAREVLPSGTAGTANLLDALDRRMQQGTVESSSLAPIARLFGVGTIVLRADLDQTGRFDTPAPGPLWRTLLGAPALRAPKAFGPPGGDGSDPSLPSVALFDVARPRSIVRTAPVAAPVVLAGDGDGIVDAASAGLIDGSALVVESAALDDKALEAALDAGAHLVVTDSNRRRAQTWFYSLRDTRGETERAGTTVPDPTGYDFRLDPFPGSTDASRTVVEQVGGRVEATSAGGPERPGDRAAHAVDGDITTAWRVGGADPRGQTLSIEPDHPVRTREVRLIQPAIPESGRSLARVRVSIAGVAPFDVQLGAASLTEPGQAVAVPGGVVGGIRIEVLETSPGSPGAPNPTPVGLAEVRIGGLRIAETVRPPVDLLERAGRALTGHGLDVVLTRLRLAHPDIDHRDDEAQIDRRIDLPIARSFALTGAARPRPEAGGAAPSEGCRADLLAVDGAPVSVRLVAAGDEMSVQACTPITLAAGSHRLVTVAGTRTGIDIDRLVLASAPDGTPARVSPRGTPASGVGSTVTVRHQGATALDVEVRTDGAPFWLVLGQSYSDGWTPTVEGAAVGPRQLVDGYANGWLVTPRRPGTLSIGLRWGPQRLVWAGLAGSGVALALCAAILWRTRRRRSGPAPALALRPHGWFGRPTAALRPAVALVGAVAVAVGSLTVAPPEVAAAAAAALLVAWLTPGGTLLLAVVAPATLFVSRVAHRPSLAWVAVILLAAEIMREAMGPTRRISRH
jgi:arabinofuranan 3-O-arabinosyltransferase